LCEYDQVTDIEAPGERAGALLLALACCAWTGDHARNSKEASHASVGSDVTNSLVQTTSVGCSRIIARSGVDHIGRLYCIGPPQRLVKISRTCRIYSWAPLIPWVDR
jgi:hypothetical protein